MSIDAVKLDSSITAQERTANTVATAAPRTSSATPAVDGQTIAAAVQDLQSHFSSMSPEFSVDYLSGLGIVRMRAAGTGEVIFQIPDTEAVQLARLIRDGASLGSLGLMKTTA